MENDRVNHCVLVRGGVELGGFTSVQGPQADVGLPVEFVYTCWPCGGVEDVPLLVPGSLVVCHQLTLHIQVGHGCRDRDRAGQTTHTHTVRWVEAW